MEEMGIGLFLGYLGMVLALLSSFMRNIQPLRIVALVGNLVGMAYGYIDQVWPTFIGNLLLFPINGFRLWELRQLIRDIERASSQDSIADLLLPHMKRRRVKAGTQLFHRGDLADEMLYLQSGQILLLELDKTLEPGSLFGEIGLFARDSRRTQTAVCQTDCELYSMTRERVLMLYYQNPKIGFNLVRVILEHVLPDMTKLDVRNGGRPSVPAASVEGLAGPQVELPGRREAESQV